MYIIWGWGVGVLTNTFMSYYGAGDVGVLTNTFMGHVHIMGQGMSVS